MTKIQTSETEKKKTSGVHLWLVMMKSYEAVQAYAMSTLRESGLSETDFRVLEALLHKGALPVNVLGPKVSLTAGSISTAVDRLHGRGLVTRTDSADDRRVKIVDLTPKGRTLIATVFAGHAAQIDALMSVLEAEDRRRVAKALKKVGKHAEDLRTQVPGRC